MENTTAMPIVNATAPARILSARDGSFSSTLMTTSHSFVSAAEHFAADLARHGQVSSKPAQEQAGTGLIWG
ncbi:hypothetical protein TPCV2_13630 [Cutibacterium avidum]|nr:hypothetical protein TPCV4_20700 [Cutibacterium avidum]